MSEPAIVFLDVDGPIIPFGGDGYPTYRVSAETDHPLLERVDPGLGLRLRALGCQLVWATTWESDANDVLSPVLGLPDLPVVTWEDPDLTDRADGLHWKTRTLSAWAGTRAFVWLDDEVTDNDQRWLDEHHPARASAYRVDHRVGLVEADLAAVRRWSRDGS